MFVVVEITKQGVTTGLHVDSCKSYVQRVVNPIGRWYGPFRSFEEATTVATRVAASTGGQAQFSLPCCRASQASQAAPAAAVAPREASSAIQTALRLKRLFLITLIVSFSVSALLGIIIFLIGTFGETQEKILVTTLSFGGFSLTALCGAVWYDRGRRLPLAYATMGASAAGLGYTVLVIWDVIRVRGFDFTPLKPMVILIILSLTFAHASLLALNLGRKVEVDRVAYATIGVTGFLALIFMGLVLFEWNVDEDFFRLVGVVGILAALGTVVTPLLKKTATLLK